MNIDRGISNFFFAILQIYYEKYILEEPTTDSINLISHLSSTS